jgi:signal peptidase I
MKFGKLIAVVLAVLAVLTVQRTLFPLCRIGSDAMEPQLYVGQNFILDKLSPLYRLPRLGEMVAVRLAPGKRLLIRRTVALEGDVVTIHARKLYVNGVPLEEGYVSHRPGAMIQDWDEFGPYEVPQGAVFLMADNRDAAADSRRFGALGFKQVIGIVRAW